MILETEDNGTLATADVLSNGQELKGQIATSSDIDFYKISIGQAGSISLSFDAPTNSSYTDYFGIGLYDSSGTLLGYQETGRIRVLVRVLIRLGLTM